MNSSNLLTKSALMSPSRVVEPLWWVGHIPFVMWLVENTKPQILVELGAHTGNSYFAMCHSVKSNALPTRCYAVDTWQGDLHQGSYEDDVYRSVKQHNDSHYSDFSDLLRMTFDEALPKFGKGTVDLLHIDGLHTYEAARHDFETWLPKLSDRAVVLFHDTSVRKLDFGVWHLWEELSVKYPNIHFDYSQGLGVLFVGERQPSVVHGVLNSWATPEGQSLVHQFFARLGQSVEFEYTIANPNQAIVKRDQQISSLNQVVSERNEQIAVALKYQNKLQLVSNELRNEIEAYRVSTSWQITRPLRTMSRWLRRVMRFNQLYKSHSQVYPGVGGFLRLGSQCIAAIRKDGLNGLRGSIAMYERGPTVLPIPLSSALVLDDTIDETVELPKNVAVHAHIYYPGLVPEMRSYLANIPVKFHCYVTTDTLEKAKLIKKAFSKMENISVLDVRVTENRGRDIFPMLVTLGAELVQHEVVLHIHTKQSPHNVWELAGWRRYLMESLLGNPTRVTAILQQFARKKNLGVLFPDPYSPVKRLLNIVPNANDHFIEKLLSRIGKEKSAMANVDKTFFPAGDMFWFRGRAIQSFVDMKLSDKDFEPEMGQVNITMAHAIERMFPYFAGEMGLIAESYISNSFLSPQCSAHQIHLLRTYIENGLVSNSTIIFDHNGGGGANTYTQQLVKAIHADGGAVLRIYCADAVWFVQWIGDGDGMLFYTSSIEELFEILSTSRSVSIVLNSLYGFPDITLTISKIIGLVKILSATLDVKTHDFFALCPSPHLLNFKGKYCSVPQELETCRICLKKNHGWFHPWYPEENKPVYIDEWRKPFSELFEAANSISVFDQSSVEILRKGFKLEDRKIKVVPHDIDYFKCSKRVDLTGPLHIGVLGTLTQGKGGDVVNELCKYTLKEGLRVPISIVGSSLVPLQGAVNVWGSYTPNDLLEIIGYQHINIILMPSIVPETFSYTISEAMEMGLPIVAFDIGAQGNRVKQYELGKVIPLGSSPDVILAAMQSALRTAQELRK
jgi:glycosyltransferase involved in cell wall biosynthesis